MMDNRGNFADLAEFKRMFPRADDDPDPDHAWRPVLKNEDGSVEEPKGKSKAEMNEAMKAAGWTRAERRRYLSNKKDRT